MKIRLSGPCGPLEGVLWLPPQGPPRAAAVVCHPHPEHGGSMDSSVVFRAARGLQAAGLAVLRFNFRGVGQSAGEFHGRGGPGSEEDDARAALDWLEERFGQDLELWAGGFSFGARQVTGLALRDARIRQVLLIAQPVLAYDCAVIAELRTPGLALMAQHDEYGTAAALRELFPHIEEVLTLEEVAHTDHYFSGKTSLVQERVRAWALRCLSAREAREPGDLTQANTEPEDPMTDSKPHFPSNQMPAIRDVMMPRDTNAVGTIFGGVILSGIDLAAAIEAHHCHPGKLVTVAMDKVEFKAPVWVGDLVSFFTETLRVGRTSIAVRVTVWAQRRFGGGEHEFVTEAQVTMVAVDDDFKPVPIAEACRAKVKAD